MIRLLAFAFVTGALLVLAPWVVAIAGIIMLWKVWNR